MKKKEMISRIKRAADALDIKVPKGAFMGLDEFIDNFNPKYPTDSISMVEAATRIFKRGFFPSEEEKEILSKALLDADYVSGDRTWELTSEGLQFGFSPKYDGHYYKIFFGELLFPLTVQVHRYADMDDLENHSDECPMLLDEDDEDWSDDCCCESQIEMIFKATFRDLNEMNEGGKGLVAFLFHARWSHKPWKK